MNIAYMILAHNQPLQLKRLIERLNQPNVMFFVHIDKKTKNIAYFRSLLEGFKNVVIISTCDVNWMGYTTIDAELDLMKVAFNAEMKFKYFVLMSGQDYPIKDNQYINNFFDTYNNDFISYTDMNLISDAFRNKIRQYHFRDIPFINPRNPKKIPPLVYLYFGLHRRVMKYLPARTFYNNMKPYFGSQWFALTHDTIGYILDYVANNPGYVKSMRYTDGPDEMFFHTIVLNSPRKSNVYDYDRYLEWQKTSKEKDLFTAGYTSLRYMDWSERAKTKPAVLDISYYHDLLESKDLFGRKFDEVSSAELMDKLDKHVLVKG